MSTDVMTNQKTTTKEKKRISTKVIAQIGVLGAIAMVLMLFDIPLPFAPTFYKIDFSEVPVLVGAFTMGPVAGALIELVKILLNLLIRGTSTAGVGDLGNFLIGCAMCIPASLIYQKLHSRKGAIIGNRNCFYDNCRMFYQCIPSASGIRCCIPYADRRTDCHGNRSQQSYQQSSDFCFTFCCTFQSAERFPGIIDRIPDLQKDQPDFTNGTRIDYNFTKQQKGFVMSLFFYETKKQREVCPRRHSSLC